MRWLRQAKGMGDVTPRRFAIAQTIHLETPNLALLTRTGKSDGVIPAMGGITNATHRW